jgi:F420-0:gamma-glutamyl ligase-like protein
MGRRKVLAVATKYWRPGEDYLEEIVKGIDRKILDGDFLVVSEKAISTALGNIADESVVKPSLSAKVIAGFWTRVVWGYCLGFLCRFRNALLRELREYPFDAGSRHKQVALQYVGLLKALMFGSEGGIDGSNLPYSYVSLPLKNADVIAEEIRGRVQQRLGKMVCVVIADTDKAYSLFRFHFAPRHASVDGVHCFSGFVAFVVARMFGLRRRATPVAVAGCHVPVEELLDVANVANRVRGFGAGRTVWDMAARFGVGLSEVSWEMLETVKHKPIVIVRSKR